MRHRAYILHALALAYGVLVGLAAIWAFIVDISMLHSDREHLLPDIVLGMVTLPTSAFIFQLSDYWPSLFSTELLQVAWSIICGTIQMVVLLLIAELIAIMSGRASRTSGTISHE
jgi:hypothetical protein